MDAKIPSEAEMAAHIKRLTRSGGAFELERTSDPGRARYRRGPKTIPSLLQRAAAFGPRIQLLHASRYTFADVLAASRRVYLPAVGASRRIGVLVDDPCAWMATAIAVSRRSHVLVPMTGLAQIERVGPAQSEQILSALVTDNAIPDEIERAMEGVDVVDLRQFVEVPTSADPRREIDPGDAAVVVFTNGTTGRAKAAVHTHGSVMTGLQNMLLASSISGVVKQRTDSAARGAPSVLMISPMGYIAGLSQFLLSYMIGGSIIIPTDRSAGSIAELAQSNSVTSIIGLRRADLTELLTYPNIRSYMGSVRSLHIYGESLPHDLRQELQSSFPEISIAQSYGMTEAFGPVAAFIGEDEAGPVFWMLPTIEATVLTSSGLRAFGSGRLHIRGASVMAGYLGGAGLAVGDWFDTGDDVELKESGQLRVFDRNARLAGSMQSGQKVYLADLERCLIQEGAADAAAWTEEASGSGCPTLAFVAGSSSLHDLRAKLAKRFQLDRDVQLVEVTAIPRRHGGKVDFDRLKVVAVGTDGK